MMRDSTMEIYKAICIKKCKYDVLLTDQLWKRYNKLCIEVNERSPPQLVHIGIAHTVILYNVLTLYPHLLTGSKETKIAEAMLISKQSWCVDNLIVVVDCSELTQKDAYTLWKTSKWSDIRLGFEVFKTLPNNINEIRILPPTQNISHWQSILLIFTIHVRMTFQ